MVQTKDSFPAAAAQPPGGPGLRQLLADRGVQASACAGGLAGWMHRSHGACCRVHTGSVKMLGRCTREVPQLPSCLTPPPTPHRPALLPLVVSLADWQRVEAAAARRGAAAGKPRDKLTSVDEMLQIAAAA